MFFDDYKGKKVVVTGAASGMGAAVTKLLIELGAEVIGADIKPVNIEKVTSSEIDLLSTDSIDSFIAGLADKSIYGLFACAGLPQTFPALDVIKVNFLGNRYLMTNMLPKMTDQAAIAVITSLTLGWVQNIEKLSPLVNSLNFDDGASWAGNNLEILGDSYIAAKEAMTAWATIQSTRLIQRGIRLNCLCPGITQTPMLSAFYEAAGEAMNMLPQPMNRETTPEEQAFVMVFMNHPRASALVGHSLYNDGGSAAAIMSSFAAGILPDA
jgi:NAD(P)-dependent dehydrogenase (short-subunit alcohol dehydrogenase family)